MSERTLVSGIGLGTAGVFVLCCMDAAAKALGAELNVFQVGLFRFAAAALWLVPFILVLRSAWPDPKRWRGHLVRGSINAVTALVFFYGIINLPLAVATALAMTAPVYISICGIVFLKERIVPLTIVALGLGIVGSLIIVLGAEGDTITGTPTALAWAAAILAPMLYAVALTLMKHHSGGASPAAITQGQSIVSALCFLPFALPGLEMPSPELAANIALVGFLGALGFVVLITGLKMIPASVFAIVDYTALIWSGLLGYLIFAETPGLPLIAGGAIIILACILGTMAGRKITAVPVVPPQVVPVPPSSSGS